ncbi:TetR/AcrR family transcriptional regulator [Nocardia amikacinitolerans]|uniref:TetR/AcrR family transcriptional regulator n=1 Tax=Nocardia amikacinitolerans TaxID=756689 RepID=UPI0020A32C3D|nr:TetR/AcrR family transcriptional regulator [Nocardia amikacinitolerans]MCP2279681.1 transcriptional regulator, TetR family [Nocardia amikacinitolerans]
MAQKQKQSLEDQVVGEAVATAPRGRPTGDHAAKRAELLDAAATVIATEGYAKASMRRVAEHAGYTTGAVTYYFANKEDMVLALVMSRFDRYDSLIEAIHGTTDVRELLTRWFQLGQDMKFWPLMPELLTSARSEPRIAELIARRYAKFRADYASILADAQARGTVRDDIPAHVLSDQLSAMGDGWALLYPVEPGRFTPAQTGELIDATIALLAPR